jgi:hypothetical protein
MSSSEVPVIFVRFFMKLELSRQVFEKYSNIKFHEYSSGGSGVVPYGRTIGQTDRRDEANSRSSLFRKRS